MLKRALIIGGVIVLGIVLVVVGLWFGYMRKPLGTTEIKSSDVVVTNNAEFQSRVITDVDILDARAALDVGYPKNKDINPKGYPKILGVYEKNGKVLEEVYFCSDLCPDYGKVYIFMKDILSDDACVAAGGVPYHDPAWEGYVGCEPDV